MVINSQGAGLGDFALPTESLFCPCTSTGIYSTFCDSYPAPTGSIATACNALFAGIVAAAPTPGPGAVPLPGGIPAGANDASVFVCKDPSSTVPAALLANPLKTPPACNAVQQLAADTSVPFALNSMLVVGAVGLVVLLFVAGGAKW